MTVGCAREPGMTGGGGVGYCAMMDAREAISRLVGGGTLSEGEAEGLFRSLLSGEADAAQWGAILGVMQARGVSVDEVVGGARVMRRFVERVGGSGPDSGLGLDPGVAVLDRKSTRLNSSH